MKKIAVNFLTGFGGGLLVLLIFLVTDGRKEGVHQGGEEVLPVVQASYSSHLPVIGPDFVDAADKTVHAVVHIKAELRQRNKVYNDFFDLFNDFFGNPYNHYNAPVTATGSGVIISPDGYIVTNNHVVQEADRLEVTLNDKRTYEAEVLGLDPSTDLALIKVKENNLPYMTYGNSDDLQIGEWVLAVGNPFNLTSTVTAGIVSAKARNINILGSASAIESFIQTDAVVNRGNSGGALVNTSGELIGINAAIASNTGSYTGYSFAIPVNMVKKVMDDFLKFGEIQRAYLGITFVEIDSKFAKEKGLSDLKGIYVMEVMDNGSAHEAGIRQGDVIIRIEDANINSKSALLEAIGTHRPGDRIKVYAMRGEQMKEFDVTLRNISGTTEIVKKEDLNLLGVTFEPASTEELSSLGIENGVKVVEVGQGKLRDVGLKAGFIVTHIDDKPVRSIADVHQILSGKRGGTLIEGVYPNGQKAYYGVGL
ncbi:MAG: Do family serine endopeptidase [Bacteroidales bacterium]|nr:Do family serine endopeptidase [Bacteroidales bacterium]